MGAYITDYQYYLNGGTVPTDANAGSYQFLSVADIINSYMLIYVGDDQIVDNVPRYKVRFHAKQAIKQLNRDAFRSFKVKETRIGSDLKMIMPSDYVNYVRICREHNGVLYPLTENRDLITADAYLKDNAGELLFDGDGEVLLGTSELDKNRLSNTNELNDGDQCYYYNVGAKFWLDPSKANGNPGYSIDRSAGVINFDSTMRDELLVLEYISDGMEGGDDSKIVVNKMFEQYMYAYISWAILNSKRGIARNAKDDARKLKRAELANARIAISDLHPSRLLMTLRGQNKWTK